MAWVLVMLLTAAPRPLVIYVADTRDECEAAREAAYTAQRAAYMCAQFAPGVVVSKLDVILNRE